MSFFLSFFEGRRSKFNVKNLVGGEDFGSNAPDLQVFSFDEIEKATNKFAFMNKLGQGGYGPVYKVHIYKPKIF